ncbi:amino acid adenylation domain-containing protein [Ruminococcus sp.]|uniref:amino acid adenylation domain-containing protein n=1 Tax=Ruminococcus sp. TaxID=41978 RepID=UPI001AFE6723|nr:amino acid adenylation domain-containing protein [Ruminococcus sp.]MBO5558447.1 amino acid adenylation domain-containing protein [Ruminococcus sp.]
MTAENYRSYPLTPAQKNIAEMQVFYSESSISTLCGAIIFGERLERDTLFTALKKLVCRQEAMRLRFCADGGSIRQFVSDEECVTGFESFSSVEEMRTFCRAEARRRFDTDGGRMYRLTVFELPQQSGIVLCCSHLIADAMSYNILAHDVYRIYEQIHKGEAVSDDVYSYMRSAERYCAYMQSQKHDADISYWKKKYAYSIKSAPIRACRSNDAGISAERYITYLSAEKYSAAERFCAENKVSPAALFESAVLLYLARINSAEVVTIGVPVLGRSTADEKKTAGMYIMTLPLTVMVREDDSAADLCKRIFAAHHEIYRRRKLPYKEIKSAAGVTGRLFDVIVSFQNTHTDVPARTEWFSNGCSELPLALHIDDRDSNGSCTLTFDYQTEVFRDSREISLLAERIKHIISQMVKGDKAVGEISVLPKSERELLVNTFNATDAEYNRDKCVHTAFAETAKSLPDKTALVFHGKGYTYRELDEMSDRLAANLKEKGIGRGDIMPITARRDPYIIVAMLAVLKTGAAYMPVSPELPADRVRFMTESVGAKFMLNCGVENAEGIALDSFDYSRKTAFTQYENSADDLCYVIFTSGSTGKPKATAVTHRNVMNYCAKNRYNLCGRVIKNEKSIVSVTDFVFDIFVTESIMALLNGITVILADDEQAVSQRQLSKLVCDARPEILQTTPTKMRGFMLDKRELGYLRSFNKIILGGEELPSSLVDELKHHTNADIYNIYGPAETTVWSLLTKADMRDITIGRPIANTKIYILDAECRLMPVGAVGEICIAGDGVSRGYLTDEQLTKERFIDDPFSSGRMYRTGDMGLMRADGSVEFFGRRDFQIKLRGLRIELGEIECAICSFEGIGLAAVNCKNEQLAGFYTSEKAVDERALRKYLHTKLPPYMVPNHFMRLEKMPMTNSGKLDRKALPDISPKIPIQKYSAPKNEAERQLCSIMAEVLKVPKVGADDDFFDLGGDSFGAMEMASLAEERGIYFSVRSVYERRTVRRLCEAADKEKGLAAAEQRLKEKYRLFPQQRRVRELMFFDAFAQLTKALYRFEVKGLENLSDGGRYIICPNHESDLDCMWVLSALRGKFHLCECCALITQEHLDDKLKSFIFRVTGGIPIDRNGDFAPALARAAAVLKKRRLLLIHPEGTRTRSGRLGRLRHGAALISKKTGVKTVPVKIVGAGQIFPVNRQHPYIFDKEKLCRYSLSISFGKPIDPSEKSAEDIMEEIRKWLE